MIYDRTMEQSVIYNFLLRENDSFVPTLMEEVNAFHKGKLTLEQFSQKLADKGTVAIEMVGDDIGGMLIGYMHDTPDQRSYMTYLIVNRDYRRQGIAGRLMDEYFAYAKKLNLTHAWLKTTKANVKAQALYLKKGMKVIDDDGAIMTFEIKL